MILTKEKLNEMIKKAKDEAGTFEILGYTPKIGLEEGYAHWMGYVRALEEIKKDYELEK